VTAKQSIAEGIHDFIEGHRFPYSRNVYFRGWELYLRLSKRRAPDGRELVPTIDIANVHFSDRMPRLKRAALFIEAVGLIEREAKARGLMVFVENIFNPSIEGFFRRRKYTRTDDVFPCYYFVP